MCRYFFFSKLLTLTWLIFPQGKLLYHIDQTPQLILILACNLVWHLFVSSIYSRATSIKGEFSRSMINVSMITVVLVSLLHMSVLLLFAQGHTHTHTHTARIVPTSFYCLHSQTLSHWNWTATLGSQWIWLSCNHTSRFTSQISLSQVLS